MLRKAKLLDGQDVFRTHHSLPCAVAGASLSEPAPTLRAGSSREPTHPRPAWAPLITALSLLQPPGGGRLVRMQCLGYGRPTPLTNFVPGHERSCGLHSFDLRHMTLRAQLCSVPYLRCVFPSVGHLTLRANLVGGFGRGLSLSCICVRDLSRLPKC